MLTNNIATIITFTISGILVVLVFFYLARPYLDRFEKQQIIGLRQAMNKESLTLRLQAYERMLLFVDRINPVNMLIRLNNQGFSSGELHYLVLTEIRNEFQHNITQQLYVSPAAWEIVKRVKNDTVSLMNSAVKALPAQASGIDFSKLILEQISNMENNPYDIAAAIIHDEAGQLL